MTSKKFDILVVLNEGFDFMRVFACVVVALTIVICVYFLFVPSGRMAWSGMVIQSNEDFDAAMVRAALEKSCRYEIESGFTVKEIEKECLPYLRDYYAK